MQFLLNSSLSYSVNGPATILGSLKCLQTERQSISEENLSTNRPVDMHDLEVGLADNRITRFEISEPGGLMIQYHSVADMEPVVADKSNVVDDGIRSVPALAVPYLFPSRYAPADRIRAVAQDLFGKIDGKLDQVLAIEQWLFDRITYLPGASDEQSSAIQTLEKREGVCRDFAHLGIAFCRALCIPARYVTVYAHQLQPQDFHAVFEVLIGGSWYLFDGTRKAPLNGMVRIAMGRDATDAAIASLFGDIAGTGLNVNIAWSDNNDRPFSPVFRNDLEQGGQVISIS